MKSFIYLGCIEYFFSISFTIRIFKIKFRHALYQGNNKPRHNTSPPAPIRISSSPSSDFERENFSESSDMIIKNYQYQIETLQRKLRISTDMCTEQEIEYKNVLKEIELNFHRMLSQRDDFIKLR